MTEELKTILAQGLADLGLTPPEGAVDKLALYCDLLLEKNQVMNLTAITDPAEVQGGETRVDNKSITTELTDAQSSIKGSQFYMNHRYKVGFYRYRRDSITDTIIGKTYVPVTSFIWTMDYKDNRHRFLNDSGVEDTLFFSNTYLHLGGTDERTSWWRLRNTVGVSMLEGFNRWAKFGLALYGTHEVRRFTQVVDSVSGTADLPDGLDESPAKVAPSHTENVVWVGGQLTKRQGSHLRYSATAQLGVVGSVISLGRYLKQ